MRRIYILLLAMLLSITLYASDDKQMKDEVIDSYVMLYYGDLAEPRKFYGETLGFTATMEDDWLSLYKITSGSYVGIIKEGGTAYHPARNENSVMLSLTVADADAWYEKLQAAGDIKILKEIYNHSKAPIRAFVAEDPGGYTVEIFEWKNK
ncbi:MAG: hypothetical protein GKR93_07340 [Gammaproteobacteria bacterium]|nr:hypothetical protein [Gammaproteobacteria bacterium]